MCERIIDYLPVTHPQLRTWPANQTCALTGNRTGNLLVRRPELSPLSHASQGCRIFFISSFLQYFCNPHPSTFFPLLLERGEGGESQRGRGGRETSM